MDIEAHKAELDEFYAEMAALKEQNRWMRLYLTAAILARESVTLPLARDALVAYDISVREVQALFDSGELAIAYGSNAATLYDAATEEEVLTNSQLRNLLTRNFRMLDSIEGGTDADDPSGTVGVARGTRGSPASDIPLALAMGTLR